MKKEFAMGMKSTANCEDIDVKWEKREKSNLCYTFQALQFDINFVTQAQIFVDKMILRDFGIGFHSCDLLNENENKEKFRCYVDEKLKKMHQLEDLTTFLEEDQNVICSNLKRTEGQRIM
jgi:hypothetical protein